MGEVTGIRSDIFLWLLEVSSTETSMDFLLAFLAPESGWRPKGATFCRFRVCPYSAFCHPCGCFQSCLSKYLFHLGSSGSLAGRRGSTSKSCPSGGLCMKTQPRTGCSYCVFGEGGAGGPVSCLCQVARA